MSFFSVEAVASLLNKTPGEITDAHKESEQKDRDAWLKSQIEAVVSSAKSESSKDLEKAVETARQKGYDEGHGRAMRETLTKAEKKLKEVHEVQGDNLEEIAQNIALKSKKQSEANPEDVKNSPSYMEMESNYKKRIGELEGELESEKGGRAKDKVMGKVKGGLEASLKELGFAIPTKPGLYDVIVNALEDDDTKVVTNSEGKLVVVGADGKIKSDPKTMKDISYNDRLALVADMFLDKASDQGSEGTGNRTTDDGQGGQSFDFSHIKDSNDYMSEMRKLDFEKDSAQIKALESHYKAGVNDGTIATE